MTYTKYPRTYHLPWSMGITNDDRIMSTVPFDEQDVVVTEKMDGENTTMYRDHIHARSLDSAYHPSRTWVKAFHAERAHLIPEDIRICGENMYAKHSIFYDNIPSYFLGFSAWRGDTCLSWDDTLDLFEELNIKTPVIIRRGIYDRTATVDSWGSLQYDCGVSEGYVIRLARSFKMNEFSTSVGKFVRKEHVQTNDHWMTSVMVKNELMEISCPNILLKS